MILPLVTILDNTSYALSPSASLAHVATRWAIAHPVVSSVLFCIDTFAAASHSSLWAIKSPGYNPSIWEIWRWPYPCPIWLPFSSVFNVVSLYHSLICPLAPTSIGPFKSAWFFFHCATFASSTPKVSAAVIVSSYNCQINECSYVLPAVLGPCSGE